MKKNWLFILLIFIAGIFVGAIANNTINRSAFTKQRGEIVREGERELINPILSCEIGPKESFLEIEPIANKLKKMVDEAIKENKASDVSIYFRLLNSGRWTGINENETFTAASLLKTLIMITYLKDAESDPSSLSRKITYEIKNAIGEEETALTVEKSYTVLELINTMIAKSDNVALKLLVLNMKDIDSVRNTFLDLDIAFPNSEAETTFKTLSPKTYSLVFRVLYGASYLNREMSEKALEILTKTEFQDGLTKKLQPDVKVAHKFGINVPQSSEQLKELHDCGIIYYPKHPYFLCVMTKGDNITKLQETISDLSLLSWNEVDKFFKNLEKK